MYVGCITQVKCYFDPKSNFEFFGEDPTQGSNVASIIKRAKRNFPERGDTSQTSL